jgi:hypothetical protein
MSLTVLEEDDPGGCGVVAVVCAIMVGSERKRQLEKKERQLGSSPPSHIWGICTLFGTSALYFMVLYSREDITR